jgi:hypothetical protein
MVMMIIIIDRDMKEDDLGSGGKMGKGKDTEEARG